MQLDFNFDIVAAYQTCLLLAMIHLSQNAAELLSTVISTPSSSYYNYKSTLHSSTNDMPPAKTYNHGLSYLVIFSTEDPSYHHFELPDEY